MSASGSMKSFFEPKSIAVAGVSTDPSKMASIIFANLRENAAKGILKASVYAVNPAHQQIGGQPCYPTIHSIPEAPELLIVAVPAAATLPLVTEAAEAGVKATIMITGGFAEAGRKEMEDGIRRAVAGGDMRILGPNTIGLLDTRSGVDTLFLKPTKALPDGSEIASVTEPLKGGVVVVTQSGHFGEVICEELAASMVGVRALVGTGNQLDVSVEDVIAYFTDDEHTNVILLYLEGLRDGRGFMRAAAAAAKKKPVVVFKSGKTDVGARAVLTHTASMVGDYEVYEAAFRQCGVVEAKELQELIDVGVALSMLPQCRGNRLAILTNAGGVGTVAADEAQRSGLDVRPPSKAALGRLRSEFSGTGFISNAALGNPIDLTASVSTQDFAEAARLLVEFPGYDMLLALPTHQTPAFGYDVSARLIGAVGKAGKPVCMCVMGRSDFASKIERDFLATGIPAYPNPERAVRALAGVAAYPSLKARARAAAVPRSRDAFQALSDLRRPEPQEAIQWLLREYGIEQPHQVTVRTLQDARKAEGLRFPVACKLLSGAFPHKTEVGGVILNVSSPEGVASAFSRFERIASRRGVRLDGMLIQEMVKGGVELILGGTRDPAFGPTVVFGVGGAYTELLQEFSLAVAPVTPPEARRMVTATRLGPVLEGYRGGSKVDMRELCGAISRFSRIMVENPSVREIEVNPLIASGKRLLAVDARMVVSRAGRSLGHA